MEETEIEKAKRYLLGDFTALEELNIDLDLLGLLNEFENEFNTIEVRDKIKNKLKNRLDYIMYNRQITDYLIDDISDSECLRFSLNLKPSITAEIINIDVVVK